MKTTAVQAACAALVLSALVIMPPRSASAATTCATVNATNAHENIIVGEIWTYSWLFGWIGTGNAGVCVVNRTTLSETFNSASGCNASTASNEFLDVHGKGGDDFIFAHTGSNTFYCGSQRMGPWDSQWDFNLLAWGEDGSDTLYGSPNDDSLNTGTYFAQGDGNIDEACGFGGNDTVNGDNSDSSSDYEWLSGGLGTDLCDGYGNNPNYDWAHSSCESWDDAKWTSSWDSWCGEDTDDFLP